jgi:hypothetical protein
MSAAMWSRAAASATLSSVSRRSRASGVRRSWDVDLPDFSGGGGLVERAATEIALAHPAGGKRQILQGPVDQARNQRRTGQRQCRGHHEPDDPGGSRRRIEPGEVGPHPVPIVFDREADPQASLPVHAARNDGFGPQAPHEFLRREARELVIAEGLEAVIRFAGHDAHTFLFGHGLDERHAGDGVGMDQCGAAQVHQRRDLLRRLGCARFLFEGAQGLKPCDDADNQQGAQQDEGAPEQADPRAWQGRACATHALKLRRRGIGRAREGGHALQEVPSGTKTYPTPQTVWM